MDNLVQKLKQFASSNLVEQFEWDIPENCPLKMPSNISTVFEKNIYLKDNLHKVLKKNKNLDNHYWVIREWGKIGSFKKNENNNKRIEKFIKDLPSGRLSRSTFDAISSLSKIASFIEPKKYVIYDSRVIYSLNWLLFNYTNERRMFPQPVGRSASLSKYDMQTIFRLAKQDFEYRSHKIAFHEYCSLIRELSPLIFGAGSEPYKLEMLLFTIAPTWVIEQIENNVSLKISASA